MKINDFKSIKKNFSIKNLLNRSIKEKDLKCNNQVIIHTEINNYRPLKEYIINLNGIRNNYKKNSSLENIKSSRIKNNYLNSKKKLNDNSNSKANNPHNIIISNQNQKSIKPYKKK